MRRTDKLWGGFSLIQDDRFFKLGQDTMLLSDFACPPARGSIMDLGCGNGALSVLLCARHPHITVTGLEIQPEVAAPGEGEYHAQWLGAAHAGDLRRYEAESITVFDRFI